MKATIFRTIAVVTTYFFLTAGGNLALANPITFNISSYTPDGNYYVYSTASASSLGVTNMIYDVDSYGDYVYANLGGGQIVRWTVALSGGTDANLHPDNPDATGPMVTRTFSDRTYFDTTAGGYSEQIGGSSYSEIYATADALYYRTAGGNWGGFGAPLMRYDLATGDVTMELPDAGSFLAYDEATGTWYTAHENLRGVYSWDGDSWELEFTYSTMAGSHMDGMEFVNGSMFVSDMTSDYILQATMNSSGDWDLTNLFAYNDITGTVVEGMGFGALDHFWVGAGNRLIEIGGGELQDVVTDVPEPSTLALFGIGLLALGLRRRRYT